MLTEARLVSVIHGATPDIVYVKLELVAPTAGVNVPATALKVPPVPVACVQTPPGCSPVIKPNKSIAVKLVSQTTVPPSTPASGCEPIVTVARLLSGPQGVTPGTVYVNVEVVAPAVGANVAAAALNIPPVPVFLIHVPPFVSPVIKLNKSIGVGLKAQITIPPSVPALTFGIIFIVAKLSSLLQGATPVIV